MKLCRDARRCSPWAHLWFKVRLILEYCHLLSRGAAPDQADGTGARSTYDQAPMIMQVVDPVA